MLCLESAMVAVLYTEGVYCFWFTDTYTSVGISLPISSCAGDSNIGLFFLKFSTILSVYGLAIYVAQQ